MGQDKKLEDTPWLGIDWWPRLALSRPTIFAFLSLFVILIIIYSNSFDGVFVFDDINRIVTNDLVHMDSLDRQSIGKCFGVEFNEWFGPWRSLAFFTFALNYHFGGLDTTGFHVVNLAIHFLTACLLFLFIRTLLNLPLLQERYGAKADALALVTAVFWAAHPIQVTSVTYIVQRMTSMSGMFYVAAMLFYLKGRTVAGYSRFLWFGLTGLSFIFAMASKENSILLIPSLILLELVLIRGATKDNVKTFSRWIFWIVALGALYLFLTANPFHFLLEYNNRPYTLVERLLTQTRVMAMYIGLLVYPTADRMAFLYQIPYSTSLLSPPSTLLCAGLVGSAVTAGLALMRKAPMASFCILFFLGNHAIESTIIPIEMVYEHRNYVPSMMFFLLVFIGLFELASRISSKPTVIYSCCFFIGCALVANGHTTYLRNMAFDSPEAFWSDNVRKSPDLSVPTWNLGVALWGAGYSELAGELFIEALALDRMDNRALKSKIIFNVAMKYLYVDDNPRVAKAYLKAAYNIRDNIPALFHEIALCHMYLKEYDQALEWTEKGLKQWPGNGMLYVMKAQALFKLGRQDECIEAAVRANALGQSSGVASMVLAETMRQQGNLPMAIRFYQQAGYAMPNHVAPILALVELGSITQNQPMVQAYLKRLLLLDRSSSMDAILNELQQESAVSAYNPDLEILAPLMDKFGL